MLSGGVQVDAERRTLFQRSLPPLIHVRKEGQGAGPLVWLVGQLVAEMTLADQQGRATTINALTQLLLVQTLRAYMAQAPAADGGWLKVFRDSKLTSVLRSLHAEPAHPWGLDELAAVAGMSRTSLAIRFREVMGVPPLTYLTDWRMRLAKEALRTGAPVAEAAARVGYASESAFSNAFKRNVGLVPGAFRKTPQEEALP
jgi:AraC-like DNA-binding protein